MAVIMGMLVVLIYVVAIKIAISVPSNKQNINLN